MRGIELTALMFVVQLGVVFLKLNNVGRGRVLTRPLYRFRFFAPRLMPWGTPIYSFVRMKQLFVLTSITFGATFVCLLWFSWPVWGSAPFPLTVIALYLDDYITGDDDKWNRFKEWAKNKIKWKMRLPQVAHDR